MKDFFVSYTGNDVKYATWVAEILETEGYKVTIQAWDFLPGDNFIAKMDQALIECRKLVVILSDDYLKSEWCRAEWTVKYAEQIRENERRIIPIRIKPIIIKGLLSNLAYIDIVDKGTQEAKELILTGILDEIPRKSAGYPSNFNLEHEQIDLDYYVEPHQITYIKSCKSRVMTPGKNSVHNRITWFVDEEVQLESLTDGVTIEMLDFPDTNLNFNVVFDHQFQRDEIIEFRVKAILSNKHGHFANFFSTEVISPIKRLSINLNLTDSNISTIHTQKISSSPMNIRTEEPQMRIYTPPFHWHIDNPELNFEYKVYW